MHLLVPGDREFSEVAAAVRSLLADGPAAAVSAVTTAAKGGYLFVHDLLQPKR